MSYTPADFSDDLHSGIGAAYTSLIEMTDDPDGQIWPEYLVTVCVAQKLAHLKSDWGILRLEEDVAETATNALKGRTPTAVLTRAEGRIDIVLFERSGLELPRYVIEVKDVVDSYDEVVKDIIRIEELLLLNGGGVSSSFEMGAIVLLIRKKNTRAFSDVLRRSASKSAGNMQRRLTGMLANPSHVKIDWTVEVVSDGSKPRQPTPEDWDEEGGPTLSGDEQLTIAMIGVFSRI
ncbi:MULTISPECIES: hypothetical protein [Komagataeibacter]|uniref:Restriction endonuclease n=1 Tax=Komagataeibacter oboediens TaxID=65958 RepID=A0ABS5SS90_9PROT|nr:MULTISPECIES: hypothetical protein [Komagataeibacter]MBE7728985.1 hypothetical protein [Komagataeibacter sp. FXV3]MBT0676999.1 hypothetical protein [Komagataeibacter oboediens]MBT0680328.1 hypothetical protein [Komagataeibacter oboediens]GCE90433.1 hypothetical protein MSKU15_2034 [Komagataeibacter diospyri]